MSLPAFLQNALLRRLVAPGRASRRTTRLSALAALLILTLAPSGARTALAYTPPAGLSGFCSRLAQQVGQSVTNGIVASSGAQMICFGPEYTTGGGAVGAASTNSGTSNGGGSNQSTTSSKNVDAAQTQEDISPSGVQAYGQSEVSIGATGNFVVEAWNDATGFLVTGCDPVMYKEELTGYGFSADGGKTFVDQGGLPNNQCAAGWRYFGDPSVETWQPGGVPYFYISSLFINIYTGQSALALDACSVAATRLTCTGPYFVANGLPFNPITNAVGDFLDKDFLAIDPARHALYMSFTRFGDVNGPYFNGQIELARCDISSPGTPVCNPGPSETPYNIVQPGDANCENEGAYPAVDYATGDVYVAWEFNWATNLTFLVPPGSPCPNTPTTEDVARVPGGGVLTANKVVTKIVSMDAAFVPGYNRFPPNDFPRIAVSDPYGTVSITWNDARYHPLGDILFQSFTLGALTPVQPAPIALDQLNTPGMHYMPALRNPNSGGKLNVSWFQRSDPNTTLTDVFANLNIIPTTLKLQTTGIVRITNVQSDWTAVSSDIVPNFGDYTDNYVVATQKAPYTNNELFVAWSDGRLGLPQPYNANVATAP